jgi:predicted aspartyl protease
MSNVSYSIEYSPPAPVLPIKLAVPGESPQDIAHFALIDTGADGTFVPTSILEELGLPIVYLANVRSYLGDKVHRLPVNMVDIILFDNLRLPNLEVVADDSDSTIILGRNVLNKLNLQLDGPNEAVNLNK